MYNSGLRTVDSFANVNCSIFIRLSFLFILHIHCSSLPLAIDTKILNIAFSMNPFRILVDCFSKLNPIQSMRSTCFLFDLNLYSAFFLTWSVLLSQKPIQLKHRLQYHGRSQVPNLTKMSLLLKQFQMKDYSRYIK